ncbi:cAMP-binding protein [Synechococcus sp. PCC 7502]|uniref:Crp/Fnr family transcriptional regulator n=1 Tax=Synechococcus sp. PCC 7502 TaxID=1173263 RepID=UPI00029FD5DF|nr:Crp/Fnr family transcriptional regulator [Synechococcus sp. PCC 7502]AFY73899.1 cAMP-binding protein [Synechococcus sp. PCC 7502]
MEIETLSETFPLFDIADPELLEWLTGVAVEKEYAPKQKIITEDTWGNAVYFILSGWVKVCQQRESDSLTLDVLGVGGIFGETAVLDEAPRFTSVIALTRTNVLSIPAQRFLQFLFKDAQVHHRMLKLIIKRWRKVNQRLQLAQEAPLVRVANILLDLSETYGTDTTLGLEIFNLSSQEISDLAGVNLEDTEQVLERMGEKGWIQIDKKEQLLILSNHKQISQLIAN